MSSRPCHQPRAIDRPERHLLLVRGALTHLRARTPSGILVSAPKGSAQTNSPLPSHRHEQFGQPLRQTKLSEIEHLLPGREDTVGVTARDNRLFVEAVLYLYRAGIPWRDLPECSGAWKVVHTRFSRWARNGLWKNLFKHLAIEADNEYAMMDRTIVRVHQHSEGAR